MAARLILNYHIGVPLRLIARRWQPYYKDNLDNEA